MFTTRYFTRLLLPLVVVGSCLSVRAIDRQKYVISAKAGAVNAVQGQVCVRRASTGQIESLAATDDINSGDVVQTGATGRVEILLNPGSYLRLAENSEFELTDTSLETLRIKLTKGASIIEVTGPSEADIQIGISTPIANLMITKRGIYRINVPAESRTEVAVRKGRIIKKGSSQLTVDGGHELIVEGQSVDLAKLDKNAVDEFDLWSKDRAKVLSDANRSLADNKYTDIYSTSPRFGTGWSMYDRFSSSYSNFGLWFFDPFINGFTFAPFFSDWGSPYGFGYNNNFFALPWTRFHLRHGIYPRFVPPVSHSTFARAGISSGSGKFGGTHRIGDRQVHRGNSELHQRSSSGTSSAKSKPSSVRH